MLTQDDIQLFIEILKKYSEYDFSEYAPKSFKRRVEKLLEDLGMEFYDLIDEVSKGDKKFIQSIVNDLTVNTTELFRDPKVWQSVRYSILPKLKNYDTINIWHPGCSTGQEVYSMMILLNEEGLLDKANLYGTDINTDVLEIARRGEYSYRLNVEYLQNFDEVINKNPFDYTKERNIPYTKYFEIDPINDIIRVKPFLREKAIFAKHDLVTLTNPFEKHFDIIMCRNVMIYFTRNLQNKLIRFFNQNLNSPGYLVLGYHETILNPEAYKFFKHGYYFAKKNF